MSFVFTTMPRSFLMKKYFKRTDSSEEEIEIHNIGAKEESKKELVQNHQLDLLSYPAEYLEYAASLLALSKSNWLQWDYELEKSYWFDTSTKVNTANEKNIETHIETKVDTDIETSKYLNEIIKENDTEPFKKTFIELTSNNVNTKLPFRSEINSNSSNETENIRNDNNRPSTQYLNHSNGIRTSQNITEVIVDAIEKCSSHEKVSPSGVSTTSSLESSLDHSSAWEENLEEKLNQMLSEDIEVVTRNIRQFLDNNRIVLDEISLDTGLEKNSIKSFMDNVTDISEESKKEFYKWYLIKVLRPPNENSDESYTCYKCGKIFTYKSYLERHIKYVCPDSSGRTWKCSFCGKAFQYPCYLRRHIRSHTGESPYKCDKCDRAFVRSTDLQRHIRNHTGEKPYCCKECSRAFARSTDLKRHMRTHTGEKPYKCWQCGKSFSQSGSLQTHLHTHNKEASFNKSKKIK